MQGRVKIGIERDCFIDILFPIPNIPFVQAFTNSVMFRESIMTHNKASKPTQTKYFTRVPFQTI